MNVETLLDSMTFIYIGMDDNLNVRAWNRTAEEILGVKRDEVLGKSLLDCPVHWERTIVEEELASWRERGPTFKLRDLPLEIPDKPVRTIGLTANIRSEDPCEEFRVCLLGADVTERRIQEVQQLHASKLESIGQLAAGIAHEINTPVQYVGDNLEFLDYAFEEIEQLRAACAAVVENPGDGAALETAQKAMEEIDMEYLGKQVPRALKQSREGVDRVASIVRAMKEFSHPGSDEKEPVDLNHLILNTLTVSRNEWRYVADVETDLEETLGSVPCFGGEISQVILNIVVNAAQAIGSANQEAGADQKGRITITSRAKDDMACVEIRDFGPGMPEEVRKRIFDPFFTTKGVGKGTGQGLAIAHAVVVKKHGGRLTCDSVPGEGTTFTMELPLREVEVHE